jgi:D-lactate dehydrogenase
VADISTKTSLQPSTRTTDILSYSHDASHYLLKPKAIYTPETKEQLAEIFELATELGIGVTFRSGGTSLSGQATSDGFLVDTRKNFRGINVGSQGEQVSVSPGATVRAVNTSLARFKRKLGPDPASEVACTIGGVVANNSSGMCCGTEQNSYRTIASMVLVLPNGLVIDTGANDADEILQQKSPGIHAGLIALRDRVRSNPDSVALINKLFSIKNTMGYGINSFLDFDSPVKILEHLVIGSEGTLAFVAEATFNTVPAYSHLATGLLIFESLADATGSLPELVKAGFAAIELMDATSLRVAQRDPEATAELKAINVVNHAALLVEFQEATAADLSGKVAAVAPLFSTLPLSQPAQLTSDAATRNQIWHIRKGLYAAVAGNRPSGTTALLEDIAVPVSELLTTCEDLIALFNKHNYSDSVIFGHARDGNIHFMINEEFENPAMLQRYKEFTEEMVELVLAHSGTLKAEHGTGRMMAPFVRRQYGDELYEVMWALKRLIDPAGILNPGIILSENLETHHENLKVFPKIQKVADNCVECGYCEPICPSKNLTLTPRKRIVMQRELVLAKAAGNTSLANEIEKEFAYDGTDTCAVDGMCATTCPLSINTGSLVRELREEKAFPIVKQAWKLAASNWSLFTQAAGAALKIANLIPGLNRYPTGGTIRKGAPITDFDAIFFPSCTGTLFGTSDSAGAFMALAKRAGLRISIPAGIDSLCCGTPWKSKGYSEGYEVMSKAVTESLAKVTNGKQVTIVTDSSSCSGGLTELLASQLHLRVVDSIQFVEENILPKLSFTKVRSVALHPTCSTTAMGINGSLTNLAKAISDEVFVPENWGCCAYAGDRGMTFPELTASATSLQATEIKEREDSYFISANRTCEIGMSKATGKKYRHILEVLEDMATS